MNELVRPFEALLDGLFPRERIRAIDGGAGWDAQRPELEQSGFLDALASNDQGGAGLAPADVLPLWLALGSRAAPQEIGREMIARARRRAGEAAHANAVLLAATIAGAAQTVLAMTVDHANQRTQFGKPVGRQQAVQQQLAVMAEQVVAIRLAAELAAGSGRWPSAAGAAAAKTIAALYAPAVANVAHAVHGAIGVSAEHDLQLFTRRLHAWRLEAGGETLWARRLGGALLASRERAIDWIRQELFGEEKVVDAVGFEPTTR